MHEALDILWAVFKLYTVTLSLIGLYFGSKRFLRHWKYRNLKKVWGLKDKDEVIVICSELDDAETRQWVEPREFIYLMKYGDADAYVEIVTTLLRIYPNIDLKILSGGDTARVQVELNKHVILIGGPDYNEVTRRLLQDKHTRIDYSIPDTDSADIQYPSEIIIYDRISKRKAFCSDTDKDHGYFERSKNPYSLKHHIILIGGCHTVGVTAAAKAFSAFGNGSREFLPAVARNAHLIAKQVPKGESFCILFEAEKIGANVQTPAAKKENLLLGAI